MRRGRDLKNLEGLVLEIAVGDRACQCEMRTNQKPAMRAGSGRSTWDDATLRTVHTQPRQLARVPDTKPIPLPRTGSQYPECARLATTIRGDALGSISGACSVFDDWLASLSSSMHEEGKRYRNTFVTTIRYV